MVVKLLGNGGTSLAGEQNEGAQGARCQSPMGLWLNAC